MINKLFRRQKRASGIIPVMLLALGIMVVAVHWTFAATGSTAICKWKDNKQAALTLSIDDSPLNNGTIAATIDILKPRGLTMTWYIMSWCVGQWGSWDDYPPLIAAGHELGPHPYGTDGTDEPTPDTARTRIVYNKTMIEQHCPGNGKCITMAWHYSAPSDPACLALVPEYMIANRQDTGDMCCFQNSAYPSYDPTENLGMFLLGVSGHSTGAVDEIIAAGGWRNMYSHNWIEDANFVPICDNIYSKRDVLWNATIRDVAQYVWERDHSTMQVVSADQSQIILNLTHTLDTTVCVFDFPLTLKTEVEAAWDSVTVVQGGSATVVTPVNEAGTYYVYFNAQPNQGQITLSAGGATRVQQQPAVRQAAAGPMAGQNPVKTEILRHYLLRHQSATVYDFTGKTITPESLERPGIYLLRPVKDGMAVKIMVVR